MSKPRIAINGFGRIGRTITRIAKLHGHYDVVAVNDLHDATVLAHMLRYDSVHGRLGVEVEANGGEILFGGERVAVSCESDPADLSWGGEGVDVVLECTGNFTEEGAEKHLRGGVDRVVVSAPSGLADLTVVMGVNHQLFDAATHRIISAASCTTNCLAPIARTINEHLPGK